MDVSDLIMNCMIGVFLVIITGLFIYKFTSNDNPLTIDYEVYNYVDDNDHEYLIVLSDKGGVAIVEKVAKEGD